MSTEPLRISSAADRKVRVGGVFASAEEMQNAKKALLRQQLAQPFFMEAAKLLVQRLAAQFDISTDCYEYEWLPATLCAVGVDEAHGWGLWDVVQWKSQPTGLDHAPRKKLGCEAIRAVAKRLQETSGQ